MGTRSSSAHSRAGGRHRRMNRQSRLAPWIRPEDLPGDVGGDYFGGLVHITREQGPGRDASSRLRVLKIDRHFPASGSSFSATGGVLAGVPWQPLTPFFKEVGGRWEVRRSTQTRTWYRRGFGHSIPARRMTAPARPLPTAPLSSATDASPLALAAPGRTEGARTSTAGRRNLSSATSLSCSRCPSAGHRLGHLARHCLVCPAGCRQEPTYQRQAAASASPTPRVPGMQIPGRR